MLSTFGARKIRSAVTLAAAILISSCVYTGKSKTYASLLEKGRTPEIRAGLAGVIRSNSEIIRELERAPAKAWLRFAVIGDSVSRRNGAYRDLLAGLEALDPPPAFIVNLGDFTRGGAEHFSYYFETVKGYPLPIIHLMGNHEAQYPAEMYFRAVFGERDFSFDYGDLRFIFMGSEKLGFSRQRLDWLEDKLNDDAPAKKIFVSHEYLFEAYPEVLRGIHLRFVERIQNTDRVLELLKTHDVPLAIFGHLHRYYEKTFNGTVMIMSGGGGQSSFFEPKPKQPLSTKKKHFTLIDLPTGKGRDAEAVITAIGRDGTPLFVTSFYRRTPGERSIRSVPYDALANDPTIPPYVIDLYRRSLRGASQASDALPFAPFSAIK